MKPCSLQKLFNINHQSFNIFKTVSHCQVLLQYSTSAVVQPKTTETSVVKKKKNKRDVFVPALSDNTLQVLNDITGVTLAINNVSWAKISIPNFALLEWNSYSLPLNFRSNIDDANILALASSISKFIPKSDMYVVENCFYKALVFKEHMLRTALLTLLNCLEKDVKIPSKVVFQKPSILNNLCNILVGAERTSAIQIVKNIFTSSKNGKNSKENEEMKSYSLVNIDEKQKQAFLCYDIAKQESLSLALLITLTFSELNIIQNLASIDRIQNKMYYTYQKKALKNHS